MAVLHRLDGMTFEQVARSYGVQYEEEKQLFACEVRVTEGERREGVRQDLGPTGRTPTRLRGPDPLAEPKPFALAGRTRLEVSLGGGVSGLEGAFFSYSLGQLHWPRESFALEGVVTNADPGSSETAPWPTHTTIDRSFGRARPR
jgi:hypothetical protein